MLKRMLVVALTVFFTLSFFACSLPESGQSPDGMATTNAATDVVTEPAPNEEIARAIQYELVPLELQSDYDITIAYDEYCGMLKTMMSMFGASYSTQWEDIAKTALASKRAMKREDAMLSIYEAACILGVGDEPNGDWFTLNSVLDATGKNWDLTRYYPEWPNWTEESPFTGCGDQPCDYIMAAYFFAEG